MTLTSPLRHSRQNRGGGVKPLKKEALIPTSPLRHRSQQGSVSAKGQGPLALYRQDLRLRFAPSTAANYSRSVEALLAWLDARGIGLAEVRSEDLEAYQRELFTRRKKDGKPHSLGWQANQITAVKSLFRFLYKRLLILRDPAASLECPRMEKRLPRSILSKDEVRRLLAAVRVRSPRDLRDRAILEILYATGIRYSELAKLTPYDVDTEDRILRVIQGKRRKDRHVPLTTAAARAIEAYLVNGRPQLVSGGKAPYLFLSDKGGLLHDAILNGRIRMWAKKAGIKKHVTCHTFRHTVATHLLRARADIRHIQALLGHASLATTERYTRVEISDLKRVIARAHPRGR